VASTPGNKAAIAEALRKHETNLKGAQLREQLTAMNADRPEGAAQLRGAFRATHPRGNLMRDPNDLSDEAMAEIRKANNSRGAMEGHEPEPPPPQLLSQDAILDAIGKGFLNDAKKTPTSKWRNVVLGLMTNLKTICPGAQNLSQILLTARRLDEVTKSGESEPDADKAKDIRSWLLEE